MTDEIKYVAPDGMIFVDYQEFIDYVESLRN